MIDSLQNAKRSETATFVFDYVYTNKTLTIPKNGSDSTYPAIDPNWLYFHVQVIPSIPQRTANKFKLIKLLVLDTTN